MTVETAASDLGLLYRSRWLFDMYMALAFRSRRRDWYGNVADLVPEGDSVVELCCGTGGLYAALRDRDRDAGYQGIDKSQAFIDHCRHRFGGGEDRWVHGDVFEVGTGRDCAAILGCLIHFIHDADPLIDRLSCLGSHRLILAESKLSPIKSSNGWIARQCQRLSSNGSGRCEVRPSDGDVRALMARHGYTCALENDWQMIFTRDLDS